MTVLYLWIVRTRYSKHVLSWRVDTCMHTHIIAHKTHRHDATRLLPACVHNQRLNVDTPWEGNVLLTECALKITDHKHTPATFTVTLRLWRGDHAQLADQYTSTNLHCPIFPFRSITLFVHLVNHTSTSIPTAFKSFWQVESAEVTLSADWNIVPGLACDRNYFHRDRPPLNCRYGSSLHHVHDYPSDLYDRP